jgi:type IV fimbrial biogenesis protein FimT
MLSAPRARRGYTMIELMVTMAILGIVMAAARPSFVQWIANSRVRATAESIQNGLMLAKAEAVRRNTKVQFVVTSTAPIAANVNSITASTTGTGWLVRRYLSAGTYVADDFIQGRSVAEGGTNTTVTADQSTFVFTGMARLSPIPASTMNINVTGAGANRPLRISVTQGAAIRMCDPGLSIATSTMGC